MGNYFLHTQGFGDLVVEQQESDFLGEKEQKDLGNVVEGENIG